MFKKIYIIGLGSMGEVFAHAIKKAHPNLEIVGYDINPSKNKQLSENISTIDSLETISSLDGACMLLCTKPHDIHAVARLTKNKLTSTSLIVSIAAGYTIANLRSDFEFQGDLVRSMPNVASKVGQSATVLCSDQELSQTGQEDNINTLFNTVGEVFWSKENLLDAVTGLSGSGPAYIFMVIEALIDGGVKMGLPRDLSRALAQQTVLGAAELAIKSGLHPAVLKDTVSTPAGTTVDALFELEEKGLRSMLISAVEKATVKSAQLNKKK